MIPLKRIVKKKKKKFKIVSSFYDGMFYKILASVLKTREYMTKIYMNILMLCQTDEICYNLLIIKISFIRISIRYNS